MATIQKQGTVPVTVEKAWKMIAAVDRVTALTKFVTQCTLEGDRRTCTYADGSVFEERVVSIDLDLRRVAYAVTKSPFGLSFHSASMQVLPDRDGARIVWTTDLSPDSLGADLAPMFDQLFTDMLSNLSRAA